MYLDTLEELKDRRKDYRILHRRLISLLREEYSAHNEMRRYFTKERPPSHEEMAKDLGVSVKTIRRHLKDIPLSDMMTLTGQYAAFLKGRKPDDFTGILCDMTGIEI
jgi:DNA-binding transcriptional regulator YhcF (GntR family)